MDQKTALISAMLAISTVPAGAVTLTQEYQIPFNQPSFTDGFRVAATAVPFRGPVTANRRLEFAAPPVRLSLPQFDPTEGTLVGVELLYKLEGLDLVGQNAVLATINSNCTSRTACRKDAEIEAFFVHGLDIDSIFERATDPIAGRQFDIALTSFVEADGIQRGDGSQRFGVPVIAESGLRNGFADLVQFRDGRVRPFIGTGDLGASVNATLATSLTVTCTPVFDFEAAECAQDAQIFLESDGYVGLKYIYEVPEPAPIPLPAGLPLLGGALLGMAAWRRFTSSRGTT
ncbi:MAG: hypothetical protein AAGH83_02250 [Pseudomonadota bacterium]